MNFLCWIHFCRIPSCKWHRFSINLKIQIGCHLTSAFHIFVIFVYNFLVWSPWYIKIYLRCIALRIWDMTIINGTRYVIERSWVRAQLGVCSFPCHKMSTVCKDIRSLTFTCRYPEYIYIYICIYCIALTIWYMTTIMESKLAKKNLISCIKLKRVINPNPLWWSFNIPVPRKLPGREPNHWHMNKKQTTFAPSNDLASITWMNKL